MISGSLSSSVTAAKTLSASNVTAVEEAARGGPERSALWFEYLTISWNLSEGIVAVGAGIAAGSIALVGFGFDSSIEGFAASRGRVAAEG